MNSYTKDKIEISELIHRQAISIDQRDWVVYRSCLADEIDFDFTEHLEGVFDTRVAVASDPEKWIAAAKTIACFDVSIHRVYNLIHDVDGDYCRSQCYMENDHIIGALRSTCVQLHFFDSIRTSSGWKIYKRRVHDMFAYGNPEVDKMAIERMKGAAI